MNEIVRFCIEFGLITLALALGWILSRTVALWLRDEIKWRRS